MNVKYRLAQRHRVERRRTGSSESDLLEYLQAAAAIARPSPEPDPSARRSNSPAAPCAGIRANRSGVPA
jgi:hypothetical protein